MSSRSLLSQTCSWLGTENSEKKKAVFYKLKLSPCLNNKSFLRTSLNFRAGLKNDKALPPEERDYQRLIQLETDEENKDVENLLDLAQKSLKNLEHYSEDEVVEARRTAADLILSQEKVEEMIAKLSNENKITDVLLQVIQNRGALARMDQDEDAFLCLDMLYKRLQTERKMKEASPSLVLLNQLMYVPQIEPESAWEEEIKKKMREAFVTEDPSAIFRVPTSDPKVLEEMEKSRLYRVDFVSEVDEILYQVSQSLPTIPENAVDDMNMAARLSLAEKQQTLDRVRKIRDIAIHLRW